MTGQNDGRVKETSVPLGRQVRPRRAEGRRGDERMIGRNLPSRPSSACVWPSSRQPPASRSRGPPPSSATPHTALLDIRTAPTRPAAASTKPRLHGRRRPADRERLRRHQRQRDQGPQIQRQGLAASRRDLSELAARPFLHVGQPKLQLRTASDHASTTLAGRPRAGSTSRSNLRPTPILSLTNRADKEVGGNYPIATGPNDISVDPSNGNLLPSDVHLIGHIYHLHARTESRDRDRRRSQAHSRKASARYGLDIDAEGNIYTYPTGSGPAKFNQARRTPLQAPGGRLRASPSTEDPRQPSSRRGSGRRSRVRPRRATSFPASRLSGGSPQRDRCQRRQTARIYVSSRRRNMTEIFGRGSPVVLPDARTGRPSDIGPTSLTLNATINPGGVTTTKCDFEYGSSASYGSTVPCAEGASALRQLRHPGQRRPLRPAAGSTYHYRVVVGNANGTLEDRRRTFTPSAPPAVGRLFISDVHSDSADRPRAGHPRRGADDLPRRLRDRGLPRQPGCLHLSPETANIGGGLSSTPVTALLEGLQAGTEYHYVLVATNQSGTTKSAEHTFTTFPLTAVLEDTCPNAHVRQQTGARPAARLPRLRAGLGRQRRRLRRRVRPGPGPGTVRRLPARRRPARSSTASTTARIPGTGNPTNHGLDPYVATRGAGRLEHGLRRHPRRHCPTPTAFASTARWRRRRASTPSPSAAPDICSPCFADGTTGSRSACPTAAWSRAWRASMPAAPRRTPASRQEALLGRRHPPRLRLDLRILEPAGSPAIYDRDLRPGPRTRLAADPNGRLQIPGRCVRRPRPGLAELDISADGSRIVDRAAGLAPTPPATATGTST